MDNTETPRQSRERVCVVSKYPSTPLGQLPMCVPLCQRGDPKALPLCVIIDKCASDPETKAPGRGVCRCGIHSRSRAEVLGRGVCLRRTCCWWRRSRRLAVRCHYISHAAPGAVLRVDNLRNWTWPKRSRVFAVHNQRDMAW